MVFQKDELMSLVKDKLNIFCEEWEIESMRDAKPNVWDSFIQWFGDTVFYTDKPQKNNRKSLIEYDSIGQLDMIYSVFAFFSRNNNKEISIDKFALFSHINRDTLYSWINKEYRSVIYIDNDTNTIIDNIDAYKMLHHNDMSNTTEILTSKHSDFVKNIKADNEATLNNINIGDRTNVGASMKLNTIFGYNGINGQQNAERIASNRISRESVKGALEQQDTPTLPGICSGETDSSSD